MTKRETYGSPGALADARDHTGKSFPWAAAAGWLVLLFVLLIPLWGMSRNRERIEFDLKFGIVKGGEAVMLIRDTVYDGRKALTYHLRGRTTGVTDKVFRVNDVYETTVDAQTHLPLKSLKNIREKKYRYYNEVFFFHDRDSIYSEKTGGRKVPSGLSDLLTVFFYLVKKSSFNGLETGKTLVVPVLNGETISNVKVKFEGYQPVETRMGLIECIVLSPVVDKGKVLKRSDGLRFYIARESQIPVQLDFETKAGTLRAVLTSYRRNGVELAKPK